MTQYYQAGQPHPIYVGTTTSTEVTGAGANRVAYDVVNDLSNRVEALARDCSLLNQKMIYERVRANRLFDILEQAYDLLEEWTDAGAVLDGQPSISIADIVKQLDQALRGAGGKTFFQVNDDQLEKIYELDA